MGLICRRALCISLLAGRAQGADPGYEGDWPGGEPVALYSGRAQTTYFLFLGQGALWVGFYDHRSGELGRPVWLAEGGADARLRMDAEGRLEVAVGGRGLRSREAYSVASFGEGGVFGGRQRLIGPDGLAVMDGIRLLSGEDVRLCGRGREVLLARRTGAGWRVEKAFERGAEGEAGKLFVEGNTWRVLVPGGAMELWESRDQGKQWRKLRELGPVGARRVVQPLAYHADLIAMWGVGERFYFTNRDAIRVYRLPLRMNGEKMRPERLALGVQG
jgi:hypothetical protein